MPNSESFMEKKNILGPKNCGFLMKQSMDYQKMQINHLLVNHLFQLHLEVLVLASKDVECLMK